MRARIIAALLLAVRIGFGADPVAWGSAVNGVRLGIGLDTAPAGTELLVVLQNTGTAPLNILIGYQVGTGPAVNFRFIATAPDGKEREGFEIDSFTPIAGLVLPAVVRLDPGVMPELRFPLKKIFCIEKPGDITFETLVRQGYSLRISFETDARSAGWAGLSHPWIGKAASGVAGER